VRAVRARLERGAKLVRRLGSRWAHVRREGSVWLFADGEKFDIEGAHLAWVEALVAGDALDRALLGTLPSALPWLVALLARGSIEWQDERTDD
jgi:hypothetical protein